MNPERLSSAFRLARLLVCCACVCLVAGAAARAQNPPRAEQTRRQQPRQPNIVLIFADDLGYADIGAFGSRAGRTPNLDRMAREGARLTSFYVASPVCTPSRVALLTGRYPVRSGVLDVFFPASRTGLDADEWAIADALRERGYRTAAIGKWHLGHLPQFLPTANGFDYYYGVPYSNDMDSPARREPPLPLVRDAEVIEQPADQTTLTRRYTEEAVRFMREAHESGKPFFVYLAHTMPHVPLAVSKGFRGRSGVNLYADVVEELDWSAGEVLKTIADLRIDRETLVVFTSDNGPWLQKLPDAGSAAPLRDGKQSVYEGGLREPFVARMPGRIPAGVVSDQPVISMDLFPTFLRLTGDARAPVSFDGADVWDVLTGRSKPFDRTFYFYFNGELQAVRTGNWKLLLPRRQRGRQAGLELYDLKRDTGEKQDVKASNPKIVERLAAGAATFDAEARRTAKPRKETGATR